MEQSLIFGGVNSSDYGIYISGEGVFNAPKRDAEAITIPGRNGQFLLDQGRFENIRVTYPAHCKCADLNEFRTLLSNYRNALASQIGYQRLEDTFNGDEYRMGVFVDGFESEPFGYSTASAFDLVFDCKPQRFLKIGEIPVPIESGDTITNPTLFDAHPLIKFNASGNGTMTIGNESVQFLNAPIGVIPLDLSHQKNINEQVASERSTINNTDAFLTGDAITVSPCSVSFSIETRTDFKSLAYASGQDVVIRPSRASANKYIVTLSLGNKQFAYGTDNTATYTATMNVTSEISSESGSVVINVTVHYSGVRTIFISWSRTSTYPSGVDVKPSAIVTDTEGTVNSTKNSLTGDLYMDLDIGEAYKIDGDTVVSINNFVNLGGELPTLPPGETEISFDNTISNVEITPRWWRV